MTDPQRFLECRARLMEQLEMSRDMPDEEILCQNDPCGWIGRIGYEDETCCFANVYIAPEAGTLTSFGFYAVGPDTSYELFAGPAFGGGFDFNSLTACGRM